MMIPHNSTESSHNTHDRGITLYDALRMMDDVPATNGADKSIVEMGGESFEPVWPRNGIVIDERQDIGLGGGRPRSECRDLARYADEDYFRQFSPPCGDCKGFIVVRPTDHEDLIRRLSLGGHSPKAPIEILGATIGRDYN